MLAPAHPATAAALSHARGVATRRRGAAPAGARRAAGTRRCRAAGAAAAAPTRDEPMYFVTCRNVLSEGPGPANECLGKEVRAWRGT